MSRGRVVARDAHGHVLRRVGTLTDPTDRRAPQALRAERDIAAAANQAQTAFLPRRGHGFRTPLNAVRYNRARGPVWLDAGDEGPHGRLQVHGTGPGIPASELPQLVEPVRRGPLQRAAHDGLGIGLAPSRHRVALMQGSLSADGTEGVGITLKMRLRAAAAAPAALTAPAAPGSR